MAMAMIEGNVTGMITFTYVPGSGVMVDGSNLTGFSNTSSPGYAYHIHEARVPEFSGNTSRAASIARCTIARAHFDPLNVTEEVICSPNATATHEYCQIGDLSGKHGRILPTANGTAADFSYVDPYLRFYPPAFSLLGRSVVIHGFNKTRLGCGNIVSMVDGSEDGGNSTYVTSYAPNQPAPTVSASLANGTAINTAGLAAINYTLRNPAPEVSSEPLVALTTISGLPAAADVTSSYEYSAGAALPTKRVRNRLF